MSDGKKLPLTPELLRDELRFLLRTLLRRDLFGEHVLLTEAERVLEPSLSLGFVEYCAFLKRHAYVDVDRSQNTVVVLPRGKQLVDQSPDPSLLASLALHFQRQLEAGRPSMPLPTAVSAPVHAPVAAIAAPVTVAVPAVVAHKAPPKANTEIRIEVRADARLEARPAVQEARPLGGRATSTRYVRGVSLGQGSLGDVVVARDQVLERDVVLKELEPMFEFVPYLKKDELLARVRAAVLSQARLSHSAIVRVLDLELERARPYVVLEWCEGKNLRQRLLTGVAVEDGLLWIWQIACGLSHAHARGVIHGGIKPENIVLDDAHNAKLTDFGLARATERLPDANTSAPPVYVGRNNPSYMAPEHLHRGELSTHSDVYALGILLYELLTGTLPGRRSPMPSNIQRVAAVLGDNAAVVDDLFDRMTKDALFERASAQEVATALRPLVARDPAFLSGTALRSPVDTFEATPPPPSLDPFRSGEIALVDVSVLQSNES